MKGRTEDHEVRTEAVRLLEANGYQVANAASGSGVPAWSRVSISKNGKTESCAIKVTSSGRVKFDRADDGSYDVLGDVDFVVHALRDRERDRIVVSMFDRRTVLDAFEENYAELVRRGKDHLPQWLNPTYESGWRFVGSGFGSKALWSKTLAAAPSEESEPSDDAPPEAPGIMDQVKQLLADHLKVDASKIEIDVRVKL